MAATRERRANAGNKMSQMLDAEEDEFYKTTYGGFEEEEDDGEYISEEEESDEVDSDFSIDENDELISDQEGDEDESKRKRKVYTKAYKEPKREPKVKTEVVKKPKLEEKSDTKAIVSDSPVERKSMRQSTTEKSALAIQRRKELEEMKRNREKQKRRSLENYAMTQEELLEEAKRTEEKNLKSLESYQRHEMEKKKRKQIKRTCTGPMIRYHSVLMPIIEPNGTDETGQTDGTQKRCSRNFVTFTEDNLVKTFFSTKKPKPVSRSICPVTRAPARYFDPVTQLPYANLQAFRILREAYYQQLEKKGDPRQPSVAAWLEWRKKNRPHRGTGGKMTRPVS